LEIPVWIIFDYNDIIFLAQGVDLLTAWNGDRGASWILTNAVSMELEMTTMMVPRVETQRQK
jgi:hypothetical protein